MKTIATVLLFAAVGLAGCAANQPTAENAPNPPAGAAGKPDPQAVKKHLQTHVSYPATRSQILAACAHTPEFSDAEKRWFEQNLPEGSYASAAEVVGALPM